MSSDANNSALKRTAGIALIVGLIGIAIAAFGFYQGYSEGDSRPLMSWLIGIAFWLSIAVGMLFLTQIWYVFHARWPVIIVASVNMPSPYFPYSFSSSFPSYSSPTAPIKPVCSEVARRSQCPSRTWNRGRRSHLPVEVAVSQPQLLCHPLGTCLWRLYRHRLSFA